MPQARRPPHLFEAWPAVEAELRDAQRLALFTDFDGTLVPIQAHAGDVQLDPEVRARLAGFLASGAAVGIVSGRALDDLRARVGLRGLWYVGSHGYLLADPDGHTVVLVSRAQRRQIARVTRRLRRALGDGTGIAIDHKVGAIAVHYRNASRADRLVAAALVQRILADEPGLRLLGGKKVWELLPATPVDKSRAVRFILHWEWRRARRKRWTSIYVGDDVADERVFAHWPGISVVVGRRARTAAQYHLRSPDEVREFLVRLEGVPLCEKPRRRSNSSRRRTS